jgi:hypothetical protein
MYAEFRQMPPDCQSAFRYADYADAIEAGAFAAIGQAAS